MNIRDFARLCGCSYGTVTNVFLRPGIVKESTRRKVLELAEKYRYRPNLVAASVKGKTKMIGVLIYGGNSYFINITEGIQNTLLEHGYCPLSLVLDWRNRLQQLRFLVDRRVDGIIMVNPKIGLNAEEREEIEHIRIPVVYMDMEPEGMHDWINTDDEAGGKMIAEHLYKLGHRRVGLYAWIYRLSAKRFTAFRETAAKLRMEHVFCSPENIEEVIRSADRPSAFFCFSDDEAAELIARLSEKGFSVPEDFSVAGYADLDYAGKITPSLTTIRQDGKLAGKCAAEIMMKRLNEPDGEIMRELVPVQLIRRKSTAENKRRIRDSIPTINKNTGDKKRC